MKNDRLVPLIVVAITGIAVFGIIIHGEMTSGFAPDYNDEDDPYVEHSSINLHPAKLADGYKLYPGVGWVAPSDQNTIEPIYRDNPNNPGELVLDIDAMSLLQKILDYCDSKAMGLGVFDISFEHTNGTHYIDNNTCKWNLVEKDPNPTQLGGPIMVSRDISPEDEELIGDDVSFFGIFVYVDNLISWIMGK